MPKHLISLLIILISLGGRALGQESFDLNSREAQDKREIIVHPEEGGYFKEAWDPYNDPLRLGQTFVRDWSRLPRKGTVRRMPWADDYWASKNGGIAYRWNSQKDPSFRMPFYYRTLSKQELGKLSMGDLAELSPAEKYDIYMGQYSYPTVQLERSRNSPTDPGWFGLCHGQAAAAINFITEPGPVIAQSVDGIKIPFGASDIKALLTFYQGQVTNASTHFLGTRCEVVPSNNYDIDDLSECRDVNAGSFHIILSNFLGLKKTSFIADVNRDAEVWNYPILGFESQLQEASHSVSAQAAPGTVKEQRVTTTVAYLVSISPKWQKARPSIEKRVFHYSLEIDKNNHIIGGRWLSFHRPDFIWKQSSPAFRGYYGKIHDLYMLSIKK